MIGFIQANLLSPDAIKRLTSAIERQLRDSRNSDQRGSLQKQLASLDQKIKRATENILLADPEDVPQLKDIIAKWKSERSGLSEA